MQKKRINEDNLLPGYNKQYRNPSTFNYYNGLQNGHSNVGGNSNGNNNPQPNTPNQPPSYNQRTLYAQGVIPFNQNNEYIFVNQLIPIYEQFTKAYDAIKNSIFNFDVNTLVGGLTNGVNIQPTDLQNLATTLDYIKSEMRKEASDLNNIKTGFKQILEVLGVVNSSDYAQYSIKENKNYDINNKIKKVLREELKKYKAID